jgi:hypothetical protein
MNRNAEDVGQQSFILFTNEWDYQVNDPRANCVAKYWRSWVSGKEYYGFDGPAPVNNPPPTTNCCTAAWTCTAPSGRVYVKQGLPAFWRNGLMETIGEIGHIRTGDVQGEDTGDGSQVNLTNAFWQTVNILSYDYGAFILDRMTVRDTSAYAPGSQTLSPTNGLVCLDTTNADVLLAIYNNMGIGLTNSKGVYDPTKPPFGQTLSKSDDPVYWKKVEDLVNTLIEKGVATNGFWSFQSLFTSGAPEQGDEMAQAFTNIVKDTSGSGQINEIQRQDPIRKLTDMISFRNNVIEIVLAAQVVGSDGTVLAEKHALATVYRDSYTGRSFVRQFKWL